MKKIRLIFFTLLLLISSFYTCFSAPYITLDLSYDGTTHKYNAEEVYLYIDSQKLSNLSMPPIILNNYTLVPAREVFENLGATVEWDSNSRQVKVVYNNTTVVLTIDSTTASVNNSNKSMDIPAKIINNKTMIPVRFVSEAIGVNITWDNSSRSIYIDSEANIIDLIMPNSDQTHFIIKFDKEIQGFNEVRNTSDEYTIEIPNSNFAIDTSYFKTVADKVNEISVEQENNSTIFSFNVNEKLDFKTFIGSDKKSIIVTFGTNYFRSIELYPSGDNEVLKLVGDYEPFITINSDNNKATIELENCIIKNLSENIQYTNFIESVKYSQILEDKIRIEVYFTEEAKNITFTTDTSNNSTIITFSNYKEPEYAISGNTITISNYNSNIDINSIKHTDNYLKKEYILTFNTNISNIIEPGTYSLNTSLVKNIVVTNNQITINSNSIVALNISESNNIISINIVTPKEKYKNIVVLDAGHGGSDPGAIANNLYEKDIVLDITNRAIAVFEKDPNIKVYVTRTEDVYPSFDDRTSLGNEVGDIFISVHINSHTGTSANGTEVYYLNENTHSSGLKSSTLASVMQASLLKALNTYDRKVKTSNLKVLRDSNIPAILCEIAFISNPQDASNLATESFRQKAAEAIYDACKSVFDTYPSR